MRSTMTQQGARLFVEPRRTTRGLPVSPRFAAGARRLTALGGVVLRGLPADAEAESRTKDLVHGPGE